MMTALNSLSERNSILSWHQHPGTNPYLLAAMSVRCVFLPLLLMRNLLTHRLDLQVSFGLHFVILYVPFMAVPECLNV